MTVEQLQVVISAKTDPIQKKLKEVEKQLGGLDKTTQKSTESMKKSFDKTVGSINKMKLALIGLGIALAKAGKAIFSMGSDAAAVDNQVVALSKTMGSSSGDFVNWAQSVAVDFGISERAAVSFGNQFSSIIARTEKNGEAVSDLTQEYLKMGAVIAANTHFEIDDVMGRIRSGLSGRNEAIEDLGIEVKPNVIKGTEAYAAAVRSGGVAWEQMTGAQQANVRTQAILEQAQRRYGVELQGTAGQLVVLRAAIDNMKLAWGRAFAPIVDFVIPVLQRLVGWLTVAATYVRAFLGLFFKVSDAAGDASKKTKDFAKNAGGTSGAMDDAATRAGAIGSGLDKANKAAKKLQRTLFGFDVIHNVNEPTPEAATGGGAGGGVDGFEGFDFGDLDADTAGIDKLNKKIEELQEKMKEAWDSWGKYALAAAAIVAGVMSIPALTGGLAALAGWIAALASGGGLLEGVFLHIWMAVEALGGAIISKLGLKMAVDGIGAAMVGLGAVIGVIAAVVGALIQLWQTNDVWKAKVMDAWQGVSNILSSVWNSVLLPIFDALRNTLMLVWEYGVKPLWDGWVRFVQGVSEVLMAAWSIIHPILSLLIDILGPILGVALNVLGATFAAIFALIGNVVGAAFDVVGKILSVFADKLYWVGDVVAIFADFARELFSKFADFFEGDFWKKVEAVIASIVEGFNNFKDNMGEIINKVSEVFNDFIKFFIDVFAAKWDATIGFIKENFRLFVDSIKILVESVIGIFKGIIDFVVGVFTGDWRKAWDGVKQIFSSMWNGLTGVVQNVWKNIINMFNAGGQIFKGIAEAISDIFKKVVNNIISGINKVIAAPFNKINEMLGGLRKISVLGAKPFSWLPTIGIPTIPQFATGGFPEDGLFHANSNELVGGFTNGKTAVVNNAQIIEGVSAGVANAVSQVMGKGQANNQPINLTVQIGSDTIAKQTIDAVDEYTAKTGISFKTV